VCPVSMVTPVQAAAREVGREVAVSPRQTEGAAGTRRRAEPEREPPRIGNGSRRRARGAKSAAAPGPGAQDSWVVRAQGAARHAPGPDGADAPSSAGDRPGLRTLAGHCPPTAALGGAGPGGGRPSGAPSPRR
jgi:hypothetical protein